MLKFAHGHTLLFVATLFFCPVTIFLHAQSEESSPNALNRTGSHRAVGNLTLCRVEVLSISHTSASDANGNENPEKGLSSPSDRSRPDSSSERADQNETVFAAGKLDDLAIPVTGAQYQKIVPTLSADEARKIAPYLDSAMAEAKINTPLRKAAFIAQTAHESAGYTRMEELASGQEYEGRLDLGNTQKGDGPLFKGRGFLQLTGRSNYLECGLALGIDLVANPQVAATHAKAARVASWFWTKHDLNSLADRGAFDAITQKVNGGQNGAAERRAYYSRALKVLGANEPVPSSDVGNAGGSTPGQAPTTSEGPQPQIPPTPVLTPVPSQVPWPTCPGKPSPNSSGSPSTTTTGPSSSPSTTPSTSPQDPSPSPSPSAVPSGPPQEPPPPPVGGTQKPVSGTPSGSTSTTNQQVLLALLMALLAWLTVLLKWLQSQPSTGASGCPLPVPSPTQTTPTSQPTTSQPTPPNTPAPTTPPTPQPSPEPTPQPIPQPTPQPTTQPAPQTSPQSPPQSAPQPAPQTPSAPKVPTVGTFPDLDKWKGGKLAPDRFFKLLGPAASAYHKLTGVPASVTLAQAVLESAWGGSSLSKRSKNLFGIKGKGPAGKVNGYRKYHSYLESIADHARLLKTPRYAKALKYANNPDQYARAIRKAGYAQDPAYASKLIKIMKKYNLYKWDK